MDLKDRIGAWLTTGGCFFRVWAPNAAQVNVILQSGTQWNSTAAVVRNALTNANGYWSATVPGVTAGQLYRYEIKTPAGTVLERLDAAARSVISSDLTRDDPSSQNASIVVRADTYPWVPFTTPRFEDFIVYQCHIGTFAGYNDQFNKTWASFADIESKLGYLRELGFNCVQPMPVQEFSGGRSWGYDPASYVAPETTYGTPDSLRHFVNAAHQQGLAVIFDVVYNHTGPDDNSLWEYDGYTNQGGIYFEGGQMTDWGIGPAWQKPQVQDYFYQNARMYLEDYNADGLRFDVTTQINGNYLKLTMARLRQDFPNKYFIAEHLPDNPWIIDQGQFCATWASRSHLECQRALNGEDSLNKVISFLGWDGYDHAWNLVKYTLGSHDDIGDEDGGNAEDGLTNWDSAHRYLVDKLGGRENWWARAKCRLAWAAQRRHAGHADDVHGVGVPYGVPLCLLGLLGRRSRRQWRPPVQLEHRRRPDWDRNAPAGCRVQRRPLEQPCASGRQPVDPARGSDQPSRRLRARTLRQHRACRGEPERADLQQLQLRCANRRPRRPMDSDPLHAGRHFWRLGQRGQCLLRALDPGRRQHLHQPAEVERGDLLPEVMAHRQELCESVRAGYAETGNRTGDRSRWDR